MSQAIERYLNRVMLYADRRDAADAERIRNELHDHLLTKVEQLEAEGIPREDAVFQAIEDHGHPRTVGYGLRPAFPWLDVRTHGTARGVIAIGPRAVGVVAMGGMGVGVFSFSGLGVGVFGWGGVMACLLYAWAGIALVPLGLAYAGIAVGLVAVGGVAIGPIAAGGMTGHLPGVVTPDQLPQALQFAVGLDQDGYLLFSLVNLVALALLLIVSWLPTQWEKRRLLRGDPKLAE